MPRDRKYQRLPRVQHAPEYIEPETTPAPVAIEDVAGFDSIPPPIQSQLRMLADGLEQVWGARKDGERLDRIDDKQDIVSHEISELGALIREFLMPAVKASQARIDLLLSHHEANKVRVELFYDREWPAAVKALEGMTERLGRVERGQERQEHEMRGMSERLNGNHAALSQRVDNVEKLEARLQLLEQAKRDGEIVSTALTTRRRVVLGALVSAGGFLSGLLGSLLN